MYFENQFYDLVLIFGHLWHPIAKWNSKKKMVENVTNMNLVSFINLTLCYGMSFVHNLRATELHEMNELCF